jgi:membrane-associated phospholipid phosphatase
VSATVVDIADSPSHEVADHRSQQFSSEVFPALEARPGGLAERVAGRLPAWHPAAIFLSGLVLCWAGLALVTTFFGLAFTTWIVPIHRFDAADERPVQWLADHRTPFWNDASVIGSNIAGGWLIPALVGAVVIVAAFKKRWLLAGFVLATIVIESGTYRATVFFVDRDRPNVPRLESLPVDASYPSGHTAAGLALYSGFALLLTRRMASTWTKVLVWAIALAIPPIVAVSRIYRGMHHPSDALAGLAMGIAALLLALLLARVTDVVARRRADWGGA